MLDIKAITSDVDSIIKRLETRGESFEYLRDIIALDTSRRDAIKHVERLKAERNAVSKKIGQYKREGIDVTDILNTIETNKTDIASFEEKIRAIDSEIEAILLKTPNLPHKDIPLGKDENDNVLIKTVGETPIFDFTPKAHWDLAESLDILDFERASKITASRFVVYKGLGARLERALINFMLDKHTKENGYLEMLMPYIVNGASMQATGQFPKFKEDAFKLVDDRDLYLNPTAEVPTINYHRDETLTGSDLPKKYAAFTTAFRQEAGSAGRDTRGIIRLHQFNKVELIKFAKPDTSYDELETMLHDSESILQALKLPYRIVELCSGDLGFSMAKTYDIEVYIPTYNTYREIGSISNAEDYQARRANIKFKRDKDSKPEYVHTLNGSGLAVGRCVVAILENYQQKDGTIKIPEVLIPYMNQDYIK
ncbi:MAG: serine--tRNA ligase [Bacillota bacterium]